MFTPEAVAGYLVTAVLTIVNLMVGYLILKHFLFKPALRFIRRRQADVQSRLEEAETKTAEANVQLEAAAREVEAARREATVIVSDARNAAQGRADSILAQAKSESAEIVAKGSTECDRMRTTVLEGMRGEVADLSVRIASRVIQKYMDESRQRDMVEDLLDQELHNSTDADGKESKEGEDE